jgi:monofunctional biosynthetic peptidoglycan transglycosylase
MSIKSYLRRLSGPMLLPSFGGIYQDRGGEASAAAIFRPCAQAFGLPEAPATEERPAAKKKPSMLKRLGRFAVKAVVWAHVWFILCTSFLLFLYKFMDPQVTVLMIYRKYESHFTVRRPVPVDLQRDIGKRRTRMLVKLEDGNFYYHHGFDLAAIKYAAVLNKRIGRTVYGGSTLSMQTARTLFLVPAKNYFRKYLEAIVTVELEVILGKDRTVELYFSTAEWGKGVFGIQAASKLYYGTRVANISDENYIRLISLLATPIKYTPSTIYRNRLLMLRYEYLSGEYLE